VPDNSTHFALATRHDFLKSLGISLIPATAPDFFTLSSKLLRAVDARRRMAARVHRSLGLTPKRYWFRGPIPAMARNQQDGGENFLRAQKIDLAGRKSWCESNDPEYVAKAADVVGLYIAPPENAIVICVDEKPSIQALERAQGYLKLPNGRALTGHSHDYKRNGTSTLFAAFEVATGNGLVLPRITSAWISRSGNHRPNNLPQTLKLIRKCGLP
jgi:hypothetical protein